SMLAGMIASELGSLVSDGEEAFIGAMFQNLGRLLTEFYFPEEARQVRGIITAATHPGAEPPNDAAASASVLGLSFEALGLHVAPQSPAWRLFSSPAATGQAATVGAESDALQTHSLQATMTRTLAQTQVQPRSSLENACEVLAAGIQDITDTLVADFELN